MEFSLKLRVVLFKITWHSLENCLKFSWKFLYNWMKFSLKLHEILLKFEWNFIKITEVFLKIVWCFLKLAIHLSFLAFRHVRALFRELFREIAIQSLYTSHNIANFVYLWFCEKLDEKLAISSSVTFYENTNHLARMAKREMRNMIGETVYEMPPIHFAFLSFR